MSVKNIWERVQIKNGDDIKEWVRVTDRQTIANMFLQWQVYHFTQSIGTPFTDEYWTEKLAKKDVSDSIINGTFVPPDDLAKTILKSMKRH